MLTLSSRIWEVRWKQELVSDCLGARLERGRSPSVSCCRYSRKYVCRNVA